MKPSPGVTHYPVADGLIKGIAYSMNVLPGAYHANRLDVGSSNEGRGSRYFFLRSSATQCGLVFGGSERASPMFLTDRGRSGYLIIEYVAEGCGDLTLDGTEVRLEPGIVFTYTQDHCCRL